MKGAFTVAAFASTASAYETSDPASLAKEIVGKSKQCFGQFPADPDGFTGCAKKFCSDEVCEGGAKVMKADCEKMCTSHANPLFAKFLHLKIASDKPAAAKPEAKKEEAPSPAAQQRAKERSLLQEEIKDAASEQQSALADLEAVQDRMNALTTRSPPGRRRKSRQGMQPRAASRWRRSSSSRALAPRSTSTSTTWPRSRTSRQRVRSRWRPP